MMTEDEALEQYATFLPPWESDPEHWHGAEDALMLAALEAAGWVRLAEAIRTNDATRWRA